MIGDDSQKNRFPSGLSDVTQTVSAQDNEVALNPAEQIVAFDWKPGDVIFDLYEVRKVSEGFGKETTEKDYYEGGFGRVYKVWHRGWNMELAVKVPRLEAYNTPDKKDSFIRECETWISLGLHPHVATCNYVRELGGIPCIFSEYATAGTLEDWIGTGRLYDGGEKVALERILDIAIQFAWGLHHAHEHEGGVIHQDVKPLNLLMMEEGTAKVSDFGLAKARVLPDGGGTFGVDYGRHSMLVTGGGGYTPAYCSPEQLAGQPLSRRTDIWSWGLSILAMFQGGATWAQLGVPTGQLAAEILETFLEDNNRAAHEESEILEGIPLVPEGVILLLRQCFQADPNTRPKTMPECADRLIEVYRAVSGNEYPRYVPKAAELLADDLNNRALSFLDLGKPDEAERLFDEALRRHPDHVLAIYNRGLMLWRAAKTTDDKVLESLRACEQSEPDDTQIALCQGWIEWERCNFTAAAERFKKAGDKGGGDDAQQAFEKANTRISESARYISDFKGHEHRVNSVCLFANGHRALSGGGLMTKCNDTAVKLWNVANGKCLRSFEGHTGGISCVCVNPNEQWALSGSYDNTIKLWDISTGQCLKTFEGHTRSIECVCFCQNGKYVLSGGLDKTIKLWDVETGRCLRTMEGHNKYVSSVAISADGGLGLSGSHFSKSEQDFTLRLWDIKTGKCTGTFDGYMEDINDVSFSADGQWAVSVGNEVAVWDIQTQEKLYSFGCGEAISLSTDGRWILTGGDAVRLWEIESGRCIRTFLEQTDNTTVYLWGDGQLALAGSHDTTIAVFHIGVLTQKDNKDTAPYLLCRTLTSEETLNILRNIDLNLTKSTALLNSGKPDEALFLLRQVRNLPEAKRNESVLHLWRKVGCHLRRKGLIAVWRSITFVGHADRVWAVSLSCDGHRALSGGGYNDRSLKLWDVASGQYLKSFEGHTSDVLSLCISSDGHRAITGSEDNTIKLWDLVNNCCLWTYEGHDSYITSVVLSDDSRWILSGSDDKTLKLWDVKTSTCIRTFKGHTDSISSISLSSDWRLALSSSEDGMLKLWDVVTGKCLRSFDKKEDSIICAQLSADGCVALSGGGYKNPCVKLWDMTTGKCLQVLEGHSDNVCSVCLSKDNRWALSGSWDGTAKLWDIENGRCVYTFEGHSGWVNSVCLSTDARWVLSGGEDQTLILWELDWDYEP